MANELKYTLSPGVRARKENFGLLFYNSKDTNLTFVKSGNLLNIEHSGNSIVLSANQEIAIEEAKLKRVINLLLEKRLILET